MSGGLLLRGLGRARGAPHALSAAQKAAFSSGSARDDNDAAAEGPPRDYDAAAASAPPRELRLIGDPRSGVADDTTQPLHGDLSIEWLWHQETVDVSWYRYALAGRDVLPHMHRDVRLSDHARNLMYLLRCKDPER